MKWRQFAKNFVNKLSPMQEQCLSRLFEICKEYERDGVTILSEGVQEGDELRVAILIRLPPKSDP